LNAQLAGYKEHGYKKGNIIDVQVMEMGNGARHESHWADPKYASESVAAILDIVEAVKNNTPLHK